MLMSYMAGADGVVAEGGGAICFYDDITADTPADREWKYCEGREVNVYYFTYYWNYTFYYRRDWVD